MRGLSDFSIALFAVGAVAAVQTILAFSLPLLAFDLSGQGTDLALIKGAGFVPNILFAIFIGVINDRIRKALAFRRYTIALAVTAALLLGAALTDRIALGGLMLFMVVFNAVAYAIGNAQMTLIRLTVPQDALADATALTSMVHSVVSTIGPAVAGLMLVWLGHLGVIWACFGLLVVAALIVTPLNPPEVVPPPQPFWPSLREGAAVLWANRELVHMTVVIVLTNAAAGAFDTALILKLKTAGTVSDFQIGVVLACAGVGAVVASRYAAGLRRWLGGRPAFLYPIPLLAGLYLVFILDLPLWLIALLAFVEGAVSIFFAIGVWSTRQETTEARHMGRVAGLTGAIFKLGMPPVIILSGVLTDAGGISAVLVMAVMIKLISMAYLMIVAGWGLPRRG